jgi:ribosomal protein L11 methyltransferase
MIEMSESESRVDKTWQCVDVSVPGEDAESLAFEVAECLAVGVQITDQGFRFYMGPDETGSDWESRIQPLLDEFRRHHPESGEPVRIHAGFVVEEDWADRWKAHFKPLRVGRSFVICPTWESFEPAGEDRLIRMDPGRAFGTGHHETTRLCIEWLESRADEHGPEGLSLLDLGTGSGILAMAGALLGFERIVGLDNDEEAIEVAGENLGVNGLSERISLRVGTVDDLDDSFDTVVANIQAGPLVAMAGPLAGRINPGGFLVLSGVLVVQEPEVQTGYLETGLQFVERRSAGEWCLLVFRR